MEKGDLFIERRKHKRMDKKCSVRYKLISADESAEIKKTAIKLNAESADISLGGIRMTVETNAQIGDIIRVEVILDEKKDIVTTFAEVKWVKGKEAIKEIGIEFLILKDKDRELIYNLLGD